MAALNVKVAVNSTGSPDCQLPGSTSFAPTWASTFLSESSTLIGKVPSNIHPAGTFPVTFRGLFTFDPAEGDETVGTPRDGSAEGVDTGVEVGVSR